jgi:thiol-disulfide isomerase/thioredoxin
MYVFKMATRKVLTELNIAQLQALQGSLSNKVLILKFGADWCGPCKKIAPAYQEFIAQAPENIIFGDIDVDENLDLYMALKKQKMVNGIPVFLAFFGGVKRDLWFIPDDSVVGADSVAVAQFYNRCLKKAGELAPAYTYFS